MTETVERIIPTPGEVVLTVDRGLSRSTILKIESGPTATGSYTVRDFRPWEQEAPWSPPYRRFNLSVLSRLDPAADVRELSLKVKEIEDQRDAAMKEIRNAAQRQIVEAVS